MPSQSPRAHSRRVTAAGGTADAKALPPVATFTPADALDVLAVAHMRNWAAPETEVLGTRIDGAVAEIDWIQRDVEVYGRGRCDNSGTLKVPLATLLSLSAEALA